MKAYPYIKKDFWQNLFFSGPLAYIILAFFLARDLHFFMNQVVATIYWSMANVFFLGLVIITKKGRIENIKRFIILVGINCFSLLIAFILFIVELFVK